MSGINANIQRVSFLEESVDAFLRLRTSSPVTLLDAVHQYNTSPLFWSEWSSGGSLTHLPNESAVRLTVNGTSGNFCRYQSRRYLRYQPGKSDLTIMTGVLGAAETGVTRRWGRYDNNNGLFLEQTISGISLVRRTSTSGAPVDNATTQSSWNVDKLDGTGPSGVTLDVTKAQLFKIDFQWLSIGRVRFFFEIAGRTILVHQLNLSNVLDTPYMATANLPVRYEIFNTATTGIPSTLKAICASVQTEGGQDTTGILRAASNGTTTKTVTNVPTAVLSIRLKSTFGGQVNRGSTAFLGLEIVADSNVYWELVRNSTLAVPVWNSVGANSIMEQDTASVTAVGGEVVVAGYSTGGSGSTSVISNVAFTEEDFRLTLDPAGAVSDILTVRMTRIGAGTTSVLCAFRVSEEY